MNQVSGFILAGGKSTRMGRAKTSLRFGGRPLILRVLEVLRTVTNQVGVIGDARYLPPLGCDVFPDEVEGFGPLGGIQSALRHSDCQRTLVVACDLPFISRELLELLLAEGTPDCIVVPENAREETEQLCAVYPSSAASVVDDLIAARIHTPRALYERMPTVRIRWDRIAALAGAESFFFNINSPEDYQRALALEAAHRVKD